MYSPQYIRHEQPFPWADFSGSLQPEAIARLRESFGELALRKVGRASGPEKAYSFLVCSLVRDSARIHDALPEAWDELVAHFTATAYAKLMLELFGVAGTDALLDVEVFKYTESDWIGPHTDRPERLVTHLFYLNEAWESGFGGLLHLLAAPRTDAVVHTIMPLAPASVAFARSEISWHFVSPVAAGRERLSVRIDLKRRM